MLDVTPGCAFCLHCYWDSIRSYSTSLCLKNLFLHLSLRLCVVARSVGSQHSTGCLVVCFPGPNSSLAKSKQIIGCALSDAFFLKFSYFLMFLNIQIDLIILKTDDEHWTVYFNNQKIIAYHRQQANPGSILVKQCVWIDKYFLYSVNTCLLSCVNCKHIKLKLSYQKNCKQTSHCKC